MSTASATLDDSMSILHGKTQCFCNKLLKTNGFLSLIFGQKCSEKWSKITWKNDDLKLDSSGNIIISYKSEDSLSIHSSDSFSTFSTINSEISYEK